MRQSKMKSVHGKMAHLLSWLVGRLVYDDIVLGSGLKSLLASGWIWEKKKKKKKTDEGVGGRKSRTLPIHTVKTRPLISLSAQGFK